MAGIIACALVLRDLLRLRRQRNVPHQRQAIPGRAGRYFLSPGRAKPHEIISAKKQPLGIYFWAYTPVDDPESPPTASDARWRSWMRRFVGEQIGGEDPFHRTFVADDHGRD